MPLRGGLATDGASRRWTALRAVNGRRFAPSKGASCTGTHRHAPARANTHLQAVLLEPFLTAFGVKSSKPRFFLHQILGSCLLSGPWFFFDAEPSKPGPLHDQIHKPCGFRVQIFEPWPFSGPHPRILAFNGCIFPNFRPLFCKF